MISSTISKYKMIPFIVLVSLYVFSIFLILTFGRLRDTLGIISFLGLILGAIPVLVFIKNKKWFQITITVMLLTQILFDHILVLYREGILVNNGLSHSERFDSQLVGTILFALFIIMFNILLYSKTIAIRPILTRVFAIISFILLVVSVYFSYLYIDVFYFSILYPFHGLNFLIATSYFVLIPIALIVYLTDFIFISKTRHKLINDLKIVQQEPKDISISQSSFKGTTFGLILVTCLVSFVSCLTLGIAYPFMLCYRERWMANHTYLEGRRLTFDGNGVQLFGNWVKWCLLTVVTLGIYALFIPIALKKWTVAHTKFVE